VSLNPSALGADFGEVFLGLLDDQVTFLEAIILTAGLKLGELATTIKDLELLSCAQEGVSTIICSVPFMATAKDQREWRRRRREG
jgi:hypothetical protein